MASFVSYNSICAKDAEDQKKKTFVAAAVKEKHIVVEGEEEQQVQQDADDDDVGGQTVGSLTLKSSLNVEVTPDLRFQEAKDSYYDPEVYLLLHLTDEGLAIDNYKRNKMGINVEAEFSSLERGGVKEVVKFVIEKLILEHLYVRGVWMTYLHMSRLLAGVFVGLAEEFARFVDDAEANDNGRMSITALADAFIVAYKPADGNKEFRDEEGQLVSCLVTVLLD